MGIEGRLGFETHLFNTETKTETEAEENLGRYGKEKIVASTE